MVCVGEGRKWWFKQKERLSGEAAGKIFPLLTKVINFSVCLSEEQITS